MLRSLVLVGAVAFAVSTTFAVQPARAEFVSGNELYRWCTSTDPQLSRQSQSDACLAYIQGTHDGLETAGAQVTVYAELETPYRIVCVPAGVEVGQLKEIVVAHLRDRPADRNMSASLLVYIALANAYPCGAS